MALTDNQKRMIEAIVRSDLQLAKKAAILVISSERYTSSSMAE